MIGLGGNSLLVTKAFYFSSRLYDSTSLINYKSKLKRKNRNNVAYCHKIALTNTNKKESKGNRERQKEAVQSPRTVR